MEINQTKPFMHSILKAIKPLMVILSFSTIYGCTSPAQNADAAKEEWVQLYNGKDMTGWTPKIAGYPVGENYNNTFRIIEGNLSSSYDDYSEFTNEYGHLFYKEKYSHYRLKARYRFVGDQVKGGAGWAFRNNGLMLHSQSIESMGLKQSFPISLEMQLLGGSGEGERSTGNLCTPGSNVILDGEFFTPHCVNSTSKTYHGDQWVNVEAIVLGDSIVHHVVEGDTVLTFTKPTMGGTLDFADPAILIDGKSIGEGYITIQAESHPTQFASIELLDLCGCKDPKAKNYKSYYIKDDRSKCKY